MADPWPPTNRWADARQWYVIETTATTTVSNAMWVSTPITGTVNWVPWNMGASDPLNQRQPHAQPEPRPAPQGPTPQQRARAVLLAHLDDAQRAEYEQYRRFRVRGQDGREYEIRHGRQQNVYLRESRNWVILYCITHPSMPDEDIMLAQKLMLEANIAEFLRVANADRIAA